jgi:hypothetical protein
MSFDHPIAVRCASLQEALPYAIQLAAYYKTLRTVTIDRDQGDVVVSVQA